MKKRIVFGMMLTLLFIGMLTLAFDIQPAMTSFPVHNIDTGLDYATIQEAIDAPETLYGQTILVDAGYTGSGFDAYKGLTIKGEDRSNIIINGRIYLYDDVTLTGFTIQNTDTGILAEHDDAIVRGNIIRDCSKGAYIRGDRNKIIDNDILNCFEGVRFYLAEENIIEGNRITNCSSIGIDIFEASSNLIIGNTVANNDLGIWISYGVRNISNYNIVFHNNFINNTIQAYDDSTNVGNIFNLPYPLGGNYWSDYADVDLYRGPYQNETGSDGIGDTPYAIDEGNQDNYPLVLKEMEGDVTGPDGCPDGKIDMRDVGMVARGFGANRITDEADPRYGEYWHPTPCDGCPHSPRCDVVYDGKIDMKDIGTTARHFGETDP